MDLKFRFKLLRKSGLISFLVLSLCLWAGCNDLSDPSESHSVSRAYLSLSVNQDSSLRTLMPQNVSLEQITKAELSAKSASGGTAFVVKEWLSTDTENAILLMIDDEDVSVEQGTYDFTLSLYTSKANGSYRLTQSGTIENKEVSAGGNSLPFNTHYVQSGDLSITLNFTESDRIGKIEAGLFTIASKGVTAFEDDGNTFAFEDITPAAASYSAVYAKDDVPNGTYYVKFTIYSTDGQTVLNSLIDVVRIHGYKTAHTCELLNINTIYSIEYELNGGSWDSGVESDLKKERNANTGIMLPTEGLSKEGFVFAGWYTDSALTERVESIGTGTEFEKDIKLYARWVDGTIYVSGTGDDSTGDGSEERPFKTLEGACEKILSLKSKNAVWTIKISGEVTGIPAGTSGTEAKYGLSTIPETITSNYAKSILLTGATGLDATGLPQDSINRNQAGNANGVSNGTVLVINTAVPVTITNLKITGGLGSSINAGGINIAQGATLSLGDGALVTGNRNTSNGRGGAIHNEGTLYMYGSAVIGDKSNGGKTDESLYTYAADSSSYQDFNNKKMANYGSAGGGIYNGSSTDSTVSAKLYLGYKRGVDGNPVKEELTGGLYYNGGTGGALYNAEGSFVWFDSGTFAWNGTEGGGGAIKNAGTLEMTGGTIEHNRALGLNAAYGGGVYNEKTTSIFIMSGGTINHNIAYRFYSYGDLSHGGAVYNNGKFFMYGTAVIGDKDAKSVASKEITTPAEDGKIPDDTTTHVSAWGNKAWRGGAISSSGGVYLGYKPDTEGNPIEEKLTGGIYYNYSAYTTSSSSSSDQYGGGAIESTGTIKMASGTIAYNKTEAYGGAIRYSRSNNCVFELSGGTIRDNTAGIAGGAIYIASDNSNNLTLSGSVLIPEGADSKHDIYLTTGSKTYYPKITIASSLSDDFAVRLTPGFYDPSMAILVNDGLETDAFASECAKFSVSDEVKADLGTTTEWYINESGKLTSSTPLGTLTMTLDHTTYSDITLSARYYTDKEAYETSTTSTSGTAFYATSTVYIGKYLVFTAKLPTEKEVSSSGYTWYFDGIEQEFETGADTSKLALDTSDWSIGVYDIAVEAADSEGTHYSSEYHITVKAN
ncbi:InlB B-repeat-containing protein [uncultured Treponema sp.]|uniref:InlB B-repeat-containing protein n=1 Tax=uncultured Treponema sp. TaxID=162155 RepID=UPI0025EA2014|nr:InlB B-repeat-containing protein [uncultured Treponema sp.]